MRKWFTGLLVAALLVTGIWGFQQYRLNRQNKILLDNQHQRAFYNLVDNVENIGVLTSKSIVSGSSQQNIRLFSDIWSQANFAQDNLSQLPLSHITLTRTQKFLTQVGDYVHTLAENTADGKKLSDKQMATLQDLHNQIGSLSVDLITLQKQVAKNGITWTEIKNASQKQIQPANDVDANFKKMDDRLQKYPTLIYDGPFSDHMETLHPKGITGKIITWDDARQIARKFADLKPGTDYLVSANGKSTAKSTIPIYSVRISPQVPRNGEVFYIDVSQKGGHVTMAMNSRSIGKAKLNLNQALEKAKTFLAKTEYKSMVPTYSLRQENTMIVSFAYKQGNVIIYPDLVKVNVALDDGQITGFESVGYLMQHHTRSLPEPKLSLDEAREKLNPALKVESERLAVIPLDTKVEKLCYEFKTLFKGDSFLIYINALDGIEEQILQLLKTPGGTWTM